MTRRISFLCLATFVVLAPACSDDDAQRPKPEASHDGGALDADVDADASGSHDGGALDADSGGTLATDGGEGGAGRCNDLQNTAGVVPIVREAQVPPPALGGTIANGTYVVTSATTYTGEGGKAGDSGATIQMTVRFAWPLAESVFDGLNRSATLAIDGASLQTDPTCPNDGDPSVTPFSARATEVQLYLPRTDGTLVYTLTKLTPR